MATSAASFVLEKLAPFFEREYLQLVRGDREEVANVKGELESMKAFLSEADALEGAEKAVKVWVQQIRDAAHDIEDILDEYMLLLSHAHDHGEGLYGFIHKMSCCVKDMKARYRFAFEIQNIKSRIRNICEGHRRFGQKFCASNEGSTSSYSNKGNVWQECLVDAMFLDKSELVGIDEPKSKLVGWLVDGRLDRRVISLSGMGGLGKTTLAYQVYDDAEVKKHFIIRGWIRFSQSFKLESLLINLVQQLCQVISKPVPDGVDSMSNYQLKTIIRNLLWQKRYLIVLDDVWNICDWDAIKHALPANDEGSRVVLTTRSADLAIFSSSQSQGEVYYLEPLPSQESWALFRRKTFNGDSCPLHLVGICEQILKKCGGLPLAIVAISGVLSTKDKGRIDEWEMVYRTLGAELDSNDRLMNLKQVLSLSFNYLPYYLKPCLLYFTIFPEDHSVEIMRLIRLWTAEGFVELKEGKTQEEVAKDFFSQLLNRSLIHITGIKSDGRSKTCRIHNLLQEIIILKSREQNFAAITKEDNEMWPPKIRRLSVHNTQHNVLQNKCVSKLRSLFMFGVEENHRLMLGDCRLLAVLDLRGAPLTKFPIEVANLYHLKYLSFRNTKIQIVPRFIGKLRNLETLDLKHTYVTELPVEVLQLQRMRHLLVYRYENNAYDRFHSRHGFKALEKIGDLQSLQKLCFVEVDQGSSVVLAELGKLTQLRRLGITKLRKEDGKKLCSSIETLSRLRALSIMSIEEDEIVDVQHLVSPPPYLQGLYLRGRLETLPIWIPYLHSLTKLFLKWSRLTQDPLVSLQDLPNLVHLELTAVHNGDTLCFKSEGFRKLKLLGLDKFDKLKWMQIEAGAMPCVEMISIQRCKSMLNVPLGIEHLTQLNVLELFDMPHELIWTLGDVKLDSITSPSLGRHGEDYWRIAHIPEVHCAYWRDGAWQAYSLERSSEGESCPRQDLYIRWK